MLTILMLAALGAVGWLSAAIARERGTRLTALSATVWRAAAVIAVVRVAVFYGGLPVLLGHQAVRPPFELVVLMILAANASVETVVAATLSGASRWPDPPLLMIALICLTSLLLGAAWTWVRSRPRAF
jgi:hypothetical protein